MVIVVSRRFVLLVVVVVGWLRSSKICTSYYLRFRLLRDRLETTTAGGCRPDGCRGTLCAPIGATDLPALYLGVLLHLPPDPLLGHSVARHV